MSRHLVEMTTQKLQEFRERDLSGIRIFALFIDTIHRAGEAFMVDLGIDTERRKQVLKKVGTTEVTQIHSGGKL